MAEAWEFYFCSIQGRPASVMVDLGLAGAAPDAERPFLLCVRVPMRAPRPDGLSSAEEAPALRAFEDELDAAFAEICGAAQVGRLTWSGTREFFYYGRTEEGVEQALKAAVRGAPGYESLQWRTQEDPGWSHYQEFLYPDPDDMSWILDRRVVDQLREHGDQLDKPRPVDHYAYFDDPAARDAFLGAAAAQGFAGEISDRESGEGAGAPEEGGEGRFGAHLCRVDPAEMGHIHEVACSLRELAAEHGGRYDGWGCPVVRG